MIIILLELKDWILNKLTGGLYGFVEGEKRPNYRPVGKIVYIEKDKEDE